MLSLNALAPLLDTEVVETPDAELASHKYTTDVREVGTLGKMPLFYTPNTPDWDTGVDQGFITNGATEECEFEYGLKIYKRGIPLDFADLSAYPASGNRWTTTKIMDKYREMENEMGHIYDRHQDAWDVSCAPSLGRRVAVIAMGHGFRKTDKVRSINRDIHETRAQAKKDMEAGLIEDLYQHRQSVLAFNMIYERVEVPTLYLGYETGVANLNRNMYFPMQNEADPYSCRDVMEHALFNALDILAGLYEDGCGKQIDLIEANRIWLDRIGDYFPWEKAQWTLWRWILQEYRPQEWRVAYEDSHYVEDTVYEAVGQAKIEQEGWDTAGNELMEQLMQVGQGGDLHTGNVGMWHGEWVSIDFSGHCVR